MKLSLATLCYFFILSFGFSISGIAQGKTSTKNIFQKSTKDTYKKPTNKILVISGGGARGAWGLGVVQQLYKQEGGYRAVFGTSTGSLMAPMVLLQQFDFLDTIYSHVTQKQIFSKNPFKVKTVKGPPGGDDTLKTEIKAFNAAWRLLRGKPTMGESENMRALIKKCFTMKDFILLKSLQKTDGLNLTVAVTNLTSGDAATRSSETITDWNEMVNWIWASANTPIFMSDFCDHGSVYVDGGLREIAPVRAAVEYAEKHPEIDTVEVVMNDSEQALNTKWDITKKENRGYFNGLLRILDIYNANTEFYNIWAGEEMTKLFDAKQRNRARVLTIIVYSMPYNLSMTYRDDLGFDQKKMKQLLVRGMNFIKNKEFNDSTRQQYPRAEKR